MRIVKKGQGGLKAIRQIAKSSEEALKLGTELAQKLKPRKAIIEGIEYELIPRDENSIKTIAFNNQFNDYFNGRTLNNNISEFVINDKETPFLYDEVGDFVGNPNFFYRRGWGIIDDAIQSGVIRVPEGDYKPAILKKYPFLDDGNPFSTMKISHLFPYFSQGELWPAKFGHEPEDLIVAPLNLSKGKWVAGTKFGALAPDELPEQRGGRGTVLIDGKVNLLPTTETQLFKWNPDTQRYGLLDNIDAIMAKLRQK